MHQLPSCLSRYAVALLAIIGSLLFSLAYTAAIQPAWPGQISSPLLLGAVAFTAWHGGLCAGLFAAFLALLSLEILFLPPTYAVVLDWTDLPRMGAFVAASALVSRLSDKRREAESALRATNESLRSARTIQQRLLPTKEPALAGFDIAGASLPANTIGGDYFDYFPMRDGSLGIVVADVSGHGPGPALLMAETRACLRVLALTRQDISEILSLLNNILVEDTDEHFITLFLASVDPVASSMVYAGAGHEAYLLEPTGKPRRLRSTCLPLGLDKDLSVPCSPAIDLVPGHILLVPTDGFCEANNGASKMYGIARVIEVVRHNRAMPAREIIEALYESVSTFVGNLPQQDDITIILVKTLASNGSDAQPAQS